MLDAPVVTIHIPEPLRRLTGGADEVTVSGETVADALAALEREHPGILAHLLDAQGEVGPGMDLYLGAEPIRDLDGLATPIMAEELLAIVPTAVSAGA